MSRIRLAKNSASPPTPPTDQVYIYIDTDEKLKAKKDDGTVLLIQDVADAVLKTLIDAKGDLLVGTAADAIARKVAGSNGQVLASDSAQSDGLIWQEPAKDISWFRQTGTSPMECWYTTPHVGTLGSTYVGGDLISALPYFTGRGGTLDRIACNVTSAGDGTSKIRLGIYGITSDTNLYPNALLVDSGELDSSTTGVKSATINLSLPKNSMVWLAVHAKVSTPQPNARGIPGDIMNPLGYDNTLGADPKQVLEKTGVSFGALPDPFPASAARWTFSYPLAFVRYSA